MEYLYAPWRSEYITESEKVKGCVFCNISKSLQKDDEHQVLYRDELCFAVMNRYPYTPGHFMIIPHLHTESLEILPKETWLRIATLSQRGVEMLKKGFGADGVNLGMNLGSAAGAGIAEHLHLHLVPRFYKDTNFMTTVANSRVYSVNFDEIYRKLKKLSSEYLT